MIFEFSNLMDESLCDRTIEYFEKSKQRSWWQPLEFFRGRTLCPSEVRDFELRKDIRSFRYKVVQEAYKKYGYFVFPEFWDIVYWAPGMSMSPHIDDYGTELEQRHYTAVCYLNDDYDGGETFFPEQNYKCKPEKGKVVIFPSYYYHGVNEVVDSPRYVIAMWFTRDSTKLFEELTFYEKVIKIMRNTFQKWGIEF